MSRPTNLIWFGRPSAGSGGSTSNPQAKPQELRQLAVVFENMPSYRRYRPGAGPRLRPITLVPLRDTTAYIRDEFFVPPPLSLDGKKRLQYVVGWTDLPTARLQVDAERISDYVSPMAYEEWCAARAAERDEEERRREEEENVRAVEEAEARAMGIIPRNALTRKPKPKMGKKGPRNRGVKRKKVVEASTPPPPGEEQRKPGRPRVNGPSLSTPSKSIRLEEFEGLDTEVEAEMEIANDDDAIFRQLNGEETLSLASEPYDSSEQSSVPIGLEPPVKKQRTTSPRPSHLRLMPSIETDSNRSTPFDSSRGATSSPALPPLPHPSHGPQTGRMRETPIFAPIPPASVTYTSTPTAPRTNKNPPKRSLLSVRDPPSTPRGTSSKAQTPTPQPKKPPSPATVPLATIPATDPTTNPTTNPAPNGATQPPTPRTGFTPLIQNSTPWTISLASKPISHLTLSQPAHSTQKPSSSTPNQKPKTTPKPKAKPKPKEQNPSAQQSLPTPTAPSTTSDRIAAMAKPRVQEEEDDEDDNIYEVLRLEGLQDRLVRGKRVRFFKVRWKGNWPPDQNPTWEPEANIPRYLTKRYLVAHPQPRVSQAGAMDKFLSSPWPQRKYSSVSEAFEGGAAADAVAGDDGDADDEAVDEGADAEADGGNEMLLVTDEPGLPVQPKLSWGDGPRGAF